MLTLPIDATPTLAVFGLPGGFEWIVILAIGLLLFGRRLPEVGRSLGQGIIEFKKGLKGVTEEVEQASNPPAARSQPHVTGQMTGQVPGQIPSQPAQPVETMQQRMDAQRNDVQR